MYLYMTLEYCKECKNKKGRIILLFALSLLSLLTLIGCGDKDKDVVISDITVEPMPKVPINDTRSAKVTVEKNSKNVALEFYWRAEGGTVAQRAPKDQATIFSAPATPGWAYLTVEVRRKGEDNLACGACLKHIAVEVILPDQTPPPPPPPPPTRSELSPPSATHIPWQVQDAQASQGIKALKGQDDMLELEARLAGGHPHDSKGEIFLDLTSQQEFPRNMQGMQITALVKAPAGFLGEGSRPNGAQAFVKDAQWRSQYGPWVNVTQADTWLRVALVVGAAGAAYTDQGFEPTDVRLVGVKFAIGEGSRSPYTGPLYVKDVQISRAPSTQSTLTPPFEKAGGMTTSKTPPIQPPTPRASASESRLSVTITSPQNGEKVPNFTPVKFRVSEPIPSGSRAILVIEDPLGQLWAWMTARLDPAGQPGDWIEPRVQIGVQGDGGLPFTLTVVVTAEKVRAGSPFFAMPEGPKAQVQVVRR